MKLIDNNHKQMLETYNLIYQDLYSHDKRLLEIKKKVIKRNLREAQISEFDQLDVMDVGTGIQSYILHLMKFKSVSHYDINQNAIKKINKLKIPNLVSEYKDLNYEKINKEFNLIYLYGVLHHIKNYNFFLNNIINNLKIGGKIFLRIYRSGSFAFYIVNFLRRFLTRNEFLRMLNKKSNNIRADSIYADFCDDVLVPNLYLFDVNDLISNFNNHNLTLIFHSPFKDYDHAGGKNKQGISLCFEKNASNKSMQSNFNISCVDQLNSINYAENYIIQNNLLLNFILKNKNKIDTETKFKFCISLYKSSQTLHAKKYLNQKANHEALNIKLLKILKTFS